MESKKQQEINELKAQLKEKDAALKKVNERCDELYQYRNYLRERKQISIMKGLCSHNALLFRLK
jgi:hypothetical protein